MGLLGVVGELNLLSHDSCSICAAVDVCMYALQHLCVALFWIGLCHATENSQRTEIAHLCSLHTLYTILQILSFFDKSLSD